ncbi:MAG: hypothetical protein ABSH28_05475 [Acidobacteriota bacterium]
MPKGGAVAISDEMRQELERLPTEELVSILQNRDEEQWRPEVFDIVACILETRGVSSSEVKAIGSNDADPEEPDATEVPDLVPLAEDDACSLKAAALANRAQYFGSLEVLALEGAGIRTWVVGGKLHVRSEDLEAALEILEAAPVPSSALPLELAEPPCPKCGSREVTQVAEIPDPSPALPSSLEPQVWLYHCASCDHKWSE